MELFVLNGSLEEISTFVGKTRATKDTLTIDYSVLPADDFDPLADMNRFRSVPPATLISAPATSTLSNSFEY